jgi:hypothetical protein
LIAAQPATEAVAGRVAWKSFVFQIFIGVITLNALRSIQMNTNCDTLHLSGRFVHTRHPSGHDTNAQKFGRMALE